MATLSVGTEGRANAPETKMAFFVLEGETDKRGNFIACLATAGKKGYQHTTYRWGKSLKKAQAAADRVNKDWFHISPDEAARIVTSTM